MTDEQWMDEALCLAREAAEAGETPVGAVIVKDGVSIGRGRNRTEELGRVDAHAEMLAIAEAERALGDWRLTDCTLYVTMEPCPMCAGAVSHARVARVVYGAADARAGSFGSVMNMNAYPFHRHVAVEGGVRHKESATLLQDFFESKRKVSVPLQDI